MDTFDAVIRRDGDWWMIRVPAIGLTQARRFADVEGMVREIIAVTLDRDLDSFDVTITIDAVLEE